LRPPIAVLSVPSSKALSAAFGQFLATDGHLDGFFTGDEFQLRHAMNTYDANG
jgi:hypothetical protein